MQKFAIVILSDPASCSDDALGRMLNALVLANDLQVKGIEFQIFFQGAGTRWVKELENTAHAAHSLYSPVKDKIKGASSACASFFKAEITSIDLLKEFNIPGIGSATSLAKYLLEGYTVLTF